MKKLTVFIIALLFFIIVHLIPIRRLIEISLRSTLLIIILNLTFNIEYCSAQWQQIALPVSGQVYQIQFINQNTGWASVLQSYNNFYLIKTTNSGLNWNVIFNDSTKVEVFQFINDTLGYARGEGYLSHLMLKTTNSGYNWTIMQNSYGYVFSGFYMVGADTRYVDAWYFNPPNSAEITFRTTNGFQNIENISTGTGGVPSTMIFLKEKYNGQYCGFILSGGILSKTTNSGYNWQIINFSEAGSVNNYCFLNKDTGWVVYNPNLGNNTKILFTSNAGQNWILQFYYGLNYTIGQIQALNKNKIWCGFINYILVSTNGGTSWGHQNCQISVPSGILMIDSLIGFAWNTYSTNNFARTSNGGGPITSINKISNILPSNIDLKQNFPNPFNNSTNIKYKTEKTSNIKLIIFDITGKKITTLINKKQSKGNYEIRFDGNNLSSGIYFYSLLFDGNRMGTKKMILLK